MGHKTKVIESTNSKVCRNFYITVKSYITPINLIFILENDKAPFKFLFHIVVLLTRAMKFAIQKIFTLLECWENEKSSNTMVVFQFDLSHSAIVCAVNFFCNLTLA